MGIPGGTREGYTWYYPAAARGGPQYSEAGPGRPVGPGVGGTGGRAYWVVFGGGVGLLYHPAGPVSPCRASLYRTPQNAASGPITARFDLNSCKVSQNRIVSPKSAQKACHSPYIQNGLRKSPLGILRFPFSVAFSPKELMVPFMTQGMEKCQNDEVSPECAHPATREVVVRYPHGHDSKLSLVTAPHLTQRTVFSSDPVTLRN